MENPTEQKIKKSPKESGVPLPVTTSAPIQSVWKTRPNIVKDEPKPVETKTETEPKIEETNQVTTTSQPVAKDEPKPVETKTNNIETAKTETTTKQDSEKPDVTTTNVVPSTGKTEKLVLDSITFIRQVKLESVDIQYYTVSEVIQEVRDSKARFYLDTFPHPIIERRPTPEAMTAVTKFAQKTGDYQALSKVDLLLLALTYTLELESHGNVDHLRKEPPQLQDTIERIDFFKPIETTSKESGEVEMVGVGSWDSDEEEDDDAGWITNDNIQEYTEAFTGVVSKDTENTHCQVACLTGDFSMQNVLLQMNMNVMSVDGLAIKTVKRWVYQCYACFKLIKDQRQLFCGNCGSISIHKVSYSVSKDGELSINLPTRKRNLRGTIYPIPLPKGGKHNNDLNFGQQMLRKEKSSVPDLNDPDTAFFQKMKNPHRAPQVIGYGKKNPNASRRAIGKKNKTQSRAQ